MLHTINAGPRTNLLPPSLADLPVAELEVLACLWQRGNATAREVREAMETYRPMSHGAMVTLLKRLEQKRLVAKSKADTGKAFVYRAAHAPQPTYRSLMQRLRQRIFGGSGATMVASLFDSDIPNSEELDKLEELLDSLREKSERRGHTRKE
ncbi:MAG: BlaI/MecI/CopY family transcriptional regulator [Candidatus Hydrogenedentes bacterium]|nr:BlaI/MecI/CopY family transcriptional regulator [Candidatus Hydrogenedentota bacterium]